MSTTHRIAWVLLAGAFALGGIAHGMEHARLPLKVYFSKKDPNWPACEKIVEAAAKKYEEKVRLIKVSIDTKEGYAELRQLERDKDVDYPGDITLVLLGNVLTSKGAGRRHVESFAESMLERMLVTEDHKGALPADPLPFARRVFGDEKAVLRAPKDVLLKQCYEVRAAGASKDKPGKFLGWVAVVFSPINCPVCTDSQFLVAVRPNEKRQAQIIALQTVRDLELYGKPLPKATTTKFLKGFEGVTSKRLERVDGVSGATKTTFAYKYGLGKVLEELDEQLK